MFWIFFIGDRQELIIPYAVYEDRKNFLEQGKKINNKN